MTKPITVALLCAIALTGCWKAKPIIPPATVVIAGCEHFGLITASAKDTVATKTRILAHNAEYLKTCPKSSVKSPSK